jgi:LacI family transcriptional regulator
MVLNAAPDVDAVFCGNDQIATGVVETLLDFGRQVPGDVAVVGYDNWEVFAAECRPPLTTVDLNLEQLGATAVEYLFAAIDGRAASGVIRQPCRLVVRDSSGPYKGGVAPAPSADPGPAEGTHRDPLAASRARGS